MKVFRHKYKRVCACVRDRARADVRAPLHPRLHQDWQPVQSYSRNALNMAAAMKAQKTGLLELRITVDRWIRVLATLTEDTLTVNPGEATEEPTKPVPTPVGAINGDPPNLSSSPVPETITNVKRTVRVTKQDVGGLGISIKGETFLCLNLVTVTNGERMSPHKSSTQVRSVQLRNTSVDDLLANFKLPVKPRNPTS